MKGGSEYRLDIWLSNNVSMFTGSDGDTPLTHPQYREMGLSLSGSIDPDLHPWSRSFKEIDVQIFFSDSDPQKGGAGFVHAFKFSDDVPEYDDWLLIEVWAPSTSFAAVSQSLTSIQPGNRQMRLLAADIISEWA